MLSQFRLTPKDKIRWVQGAVHNVRINLPNTKDEAFIAEMEESLGDLLYGSKKRCEAIQRQVESSF